MTNHRDAENAEERAGERILLVETLALLFAAAIFYTIKVKHEESYEVALGQVQQASKEGKQRGAIALLESALTNFPRLDGMKLLEHLQRTIKEKEKFRAGLKRDWVL